MLKSRSWLRLLSVELLVTSTSGDSPSTSTDSLIPPTFMVNEASAVLPMVTGMSSIFRVRKPVSSTVTAYVPESTPTKR